MTSIHELAARAMRLMDSIPCGPDGKSCDGGIPVYRCPAHGGEHDGETPADTEAREAFEQRWGNEVRR
jgi:hypothetical protein